METIILASGSPRRQELLSRVRIPFKAFPPNIAEEFEHIPDVAERVRQIALKKIEAVRGGLPAGVPALGAGPGHSGGAGRPGPGQAGGAGAGRRKF